MTHDDDNKISRQTTTDDQGQAARAPEPGKTPQPGDQITVIVTDNAGNITTKVVLVLALTVADKEIVLPEETSQQATGRYFQPGELVHGRSVRQEGGETDLGWRTADANGQVVFAWTVADADSSLGGHTVILTGNHSGPGKDTFQVVRQTPTPPDTTGPPTTPPDSGPPTAPPSQKPPPTGKPPLPSTGAPVTTGALAAAGLALAVGLALVGAGWRRRRQNRTTAHAQHRA
ncbi:MAG: LPXTG cell wall anchor domain-containing protein [Propionibacteriaceae bacterium]|nr:LPXTG cell wall anchor domain-containing protein [Propionibacteriaceae bacterium]